jgi:hypothetical protein
MITDQDKHFLRLVARSPDRGDGWRTVSETCWPLVEQVGTKELIEVDKDNMRVRLTSDGEAVVLYAL